MSSGERGARAPLPHRIAVSLAPLSRVLRSRCPAPPSRRCVLPGAGGLRGPLPTGSLSRVASGVAGRGRAALVGRMGMGKRLRSEFVTVPCPSVPIPGATLRHCGSARLPGGVSLAAVPGEGSLGLRSRHKFFSIPGHRSSGPAGGRMGERGRGGRLVPPNPWGCLSQLFPEKS